MERPLNSQALKNIRSQVQTTIQEAKVRASRVHIDKARRIGGDWAGFPKDDKDLAAYITSLAQKNRYNDINAFYARMEKTPKRWAQSFIYVPKATGVASLPLIAEAAVYAEEIVRKQTQAYPTYKWERRGKVYTSPRTGRLFSSIKKSVNRREVSNSKQAILSSDRGGETIFRIWNDAPYASAAEAHALYFTKMRGIIFFAANKVQRKYPSLGVLFYFQQSETHKYQEPVLAIGAADVVSGRWSRPGDNIRTRKGYIRRLKGYVKRSGVEVL